MLGDQPFGEGGQPVFGGLGASECFGVGGVGGLRPGGRDRGLAVGAGGPVLGAAPCRFGVLAGGVRGVAVLPGGGELVA